jgi:hypothetical protein
LTRQVLALSTALLLQGSPEVVQQPGAPPPSLTSRSDYTVKPGKEDEFLHLVESVGGPVFDRLMADGVVTAWGIEVPLLRSPGGANRTIWYSTLGYAGVAKVEGALAVQLAKPAPGVAVAKGTRPMPAEVRPLEVFDVTRTRDWLTRDLEVGFARSMPASGVLPVIRYSFEKVQPGKGPEYLRAWNRYSRPVLERLAADGVVIAWGLAVEELRTSGDFTHVSWTATADLAGQDLVHAAVAAVRAARSADERDIIAASFDGAVVADASRSSIARSILFRLPAPKP